LIALNHPHKVVLWQTDIHCANSLLGGMSIDTTFDPLPSSLDITFTQRFSKSLLIVQVNRVNPESENWEKISQTWLLNLHFSLSQPLQTNPFIYQYFLSVWPCVTLVYTVCVYQSIWSLFYMLSVVIRGLFVIHLHISPIF